jgi:hypothetical protein
MARKHHRKASILILADHLDDNLRPLLRDRADRRIEIAIGILLLPNGVEMRRPVGEQFATRDDQLAQALGEIGDVAPVRLLAVHESPFDRRVIGSTKGPLYAAWSVR